MECFTPNSPFLDLVQDLHDDSQDINFDEIFGTSNHHVDDEFGDEIDTFTVQQQRTPVVETAGTSHPIASTSDGNDDSFPGEIEPSGDIGQQELEMTGPSDPVGDIFDRLLLEGHNFDAFMDNPMNFPQEQIPDNVVENKAEYVNADTDTSMPLIPWTAEPVPSSCDSCQVLRQILHSNGIQTTKLEIHGIVGVIYHGILEIQCDVNGIPTMAQREMVDFCPHSMEDVKQYLEHYCQEKKDAGFIMLQDPLESFYSVLHVGICSKEDLNMSGLRQPLETGIGVSPRREPVPNGHSFRRPNQSSLSAQRERTGKLTLNDLVAYFNLPIEIAGKRLAVCPTVIKKVCRRYKLSRWPYRKIQSFNGKISKLEERLDRKSGLERIEIQERIESLKQQRDKIVNDIMQGC